MSNIAEQDAQLVFEFFKKNPFPKDTQISELSKKSGINETVLREIIYTFVGTFASGGASISETSVNAQELGLGIKTEMEHLNNNSPVANIMAKKISLDHLDEHKKYYSRLQELEKSEEPKTDIQESSFNNLYNKILRG